VEALPSYVLRSYRLEWITKDDGDGNAASGVIDLPVITPGSPPLEFSVPAGRLTSVRLVTPTGYAVADGQQTEK
jgi:hypothetical protein